VSGDWPREQEKKGKCWEQGPSMWLALGGGVAVFGGERRCWC